MNEGNDYMEIYYELKNVLSQDKPIVKKLIQAKELLEQFDVRFA